MSNVEQKIESPGTRSEGLGAATPPALRICGIAKTYGPVQALTPTDFELRAGQVHALVGENGSGKSTVVGILSGAVRPDTGTVSCGDCLLRRSVPWESQKLGIQTVFQDGTLIAELTVAQNLYLGTPCDQRPAYRNITAWARRRLEEHGLDQIDPARRAGDLAPGDRQLVDIVRALATRPKVLLLDEATSSLDASGVDTALDLMRRAADQGAAVLLVTHRLFEVFRVADVISVLRDGGWQGTWAASDVDSTTLVELMAGTSVNVEFPRRTDSAAPAAAQVTATGLRGRNFGPVDLQLRRGEILGLAGADGNGQLDLLRALAGLGLTGGSLRTGTKTVRGFQDACSAGITYLSSDRREESLFPSLAIRENLVAGVLGRMARLGYIGMRNERGVTGASVETFGIRLGSVEDHITSLSGGNQQKVALSRALATEPSVLLVDEPTQGVDVRSRIDIYHMLRNAADAGSSVVVVSSDAAELAGLCDRILVVSRGRTVAELGGEDSSEERIIHAFTGARQLGAEPEGGPVATAASRRWGRLRLGQDARRLGVVVLMLLILGAYTQSRASSFLGEASLYNVMLLALPLAVVAGAEFLVMFTGSIDVSVGSNMGLTVALLSFIFTGAGLAVGLPVFLLTAIGIGIVIGTANAFVIERIRIPAVIATIAGLGILQGLGIVIRPQAAGTINSHVVSALTTKVGPVPIPLLIVVAVFLLADVGLRTTGRGLRLRSVGLNSVLAYRLGENTPRIRQVGYVGCAILASMAGVLLAAQVGTGDSTVGSQYTLLAVAAPILGGASLLGGRGSFAGCLVGALLLAMAEALPAVLSLSNGMSQTLAGALTLVALLVYSGSGASVTDRIRRVARRLVGS